MNLKGSLRVAAIAAVIILINIGLWPVPVILAAIAITAQQWHRRSRHTPTNSSS